MSPSEITDCFRKGLLQLRDGTLNDEACLCLGYLSMEPHLVGNDHRNTGSHCFNHRNSKIFRVRREDEYVCVQQGVSFLFTLEKSYPQKRVLQAQLTSLFP